MNIEQLEALLVRIAKGNISEYHLTPGAKPFYRVNGTISEEVETDRISLIYMSDIVHLLLTKEEQEVLFSTGSYEIAYPIPNVGRFRMRFGKQRSSITLVIHVKSTVIPSVKNLNIPEQVVEKMTMTSGLFIVSGETKSNKSTTVAALINEVVQSVPRIVSTIENPIEYLLPHGKGIVNQMEVGVDIKTISKGISEATNNHVDIIYVNEVKSKDEWQLIFDALEKGFFVIVSMNSNGVETALDHLLFHFNRDEQPFIKRILANHLNAFIFEMNLETKDNEVMPVYEVLLNNKAVRNMFLENKLNQLPEIFNAFPKTDIKSIDKAIYEAIISGAIDRDYGLSKARNQADLMKMLNGISK